MNATPSVFVEPDIGLEWQRILNDKGWLAYQWPVENGGTGWTPGAALHLRKGMRAGRRAVALRARPEARRPGDLPIRHARAKGALPAAHPVGRRLLVPGLFRTRLAAPTSPASRPAPCATAIDYVINGTKIWTTHAHHADWMFCLVRTDPRRANRRRASRFLLMRMKQPGVTVRADHRRSPAITRSTRCSSTMPTRLVAEPHRRGRPGLDHRQVPAGKRTRRQLHGPAPARPDRPPGSRRRRTAWAASARTPEFARAARPRPAGSRGAGNDRTAHHRRTRQGKRPGPQTSLIKLRLLEPLPDHRRADPWTAFGHDALQLPRRTPALRQRKPRTGRQSKAAQTGDADYLNNRAVTIFGGSNEVQKNILAKTVSGALKEPPAARA